MTEVEKINKQEKKTLTSLIPAICKKLKFDLSLLFFRTQQFSIPKMTHQSITPSFNMNLLLFSVSHSSFVISTTRSIEVEDHPAHTKYKNKIDAESKKSVHPP